MEASFPFAGTSFYDRFIYGFRRAIYGAAGGYGLAPQFGFQEAGMHLVLLGNARALT